jgi:uncharacterized protein (DUF1778 family)
MVKTGKVKNKLVQVRMTQSQKEIIARAANRRGLGLSTWMLSLSLEHARRG